MRRITGTAAIATPARKGEAANALKPGLLSQLRKGAIKLVHTGAIATQPSVSRRSVAGKTHEMIGLVRVTAPFYHLPPPFSSEICFMTLRSSGPSSYARSLKICRADGAKHFVSGLKLIQQPSFFLLYESYGGFAIRQGGAEGCVGETFYDGASAVHVLGRV